MEIRLLNVTCKTYLELKNINLKFNSNSLTGIYGDSFEIIPQLLKQEIPYHGNIYLDDKDIVSSKKKFNYLKLLDKDTFLTNVVSDEFYLHQKDLNLKDSEYLSKIVSSLKMVGLNKSYLKREIASLSKSEKRLLEIALELIDDPDIIIVTEPFLYLNREYSHTLKKIFLDLKNKYKKIIIMESNDINVLFEMCDELVILKDNNILISGKTNSIFKDIEFLENNNVPLPNIVLFNQIALKYNKKMPIVKNNDSLVKGVLNYVFESNKETSDN